jgi:glutathione S-transferase
MKLYFSPGACSFAPHLALHEAWRFRRRREGRPPRAQDRRRRRLLRRQSEGLRAVPRARRRHDAVGSARDPAIHRDRKPGTIAPAYGTIERYKVNEWLGFVATEIHKSYSPLWHPEEFGEKAVDALKNKLHKRYGSSRRSSRRRSTWPATSTRSPTCTCTR